jgi:hypothetical protein
VVFIGALSLLIAGGTGYAAVGGLCSNCHTMHNSQGGDPEAVNELNAPSTTSYAHLTKSNCIGCHVKATSVSGPKIDGTSATNDLRAGGTFAVAVATDDTKRHDVIDLSTYNAAYDGDGNHSATPGNTNSDQTVGPDELTCAGTKGCHGDATIDGSDAAIQGFHHGSKTGYRFLQNAGDQGAVLGLGSDDWELDGATAANHNIYSADTSYGISRLCANCHGNFHAKADGAAGDGTKGDGTEWIRHPTDNLIPDSWDGVAPDDVTIDPENNPFAFASLTGLATDVMTNYVVNEAGNGGRVACISCHRAHGSGESDILRWAYSDQVAGSGFDTGCLGCHTAQR